MERNRTEMRGGGAKTEAGWKEGRKGDRGKGEEEQEG